MRSRLRLRNLVCTVITGVVACAGAAGAAGPAPAFIGNCSWTVSNVASGLGSLENLAFDGDGAILLSRTVNGAGQIYRLATEGTGTGRTLAEVDSHGGIAISEGTAYFTTGNTFAAGVAGRADGTITALDLSQFRLTSIARGLIMPSSLIRLPNGEFVVNRNLGLSTG